MGDVDVVEQYPSKNEYTLWPAPCPHQALQHIAGNYQTLSFYHLIIPSFFIINKQLLFHLHVMAVPRGLAALFDFMLYCINIVFSFIQCLLVDLSQSFFIDLIV